MIGRDRRYGRSRQASLKAKVGIAAAVLVGAGAIGVAAAATSHSPSSASNASYSFGLHHNQHRSRHTHRRLSQEQLLQSLLTANSWNNRFAYLTQMNTTMNFATWRNAQTRQVQAVQRGTVLLVGRNFIVVKSQNSGHPQLWIATPTATKFFNTSNSMAGMTALGSNTFAADEMMNSNNATPLINLLSSQNFIQQTAAPAAAPSTFTVSVTGTAAGTVTVTVTVNGSMATMNQFGTNGFRAFGTQNAFFTGVQGLQRGDLVTIAGVRQGGFLHAQLVLFTPAATTSGTTTGGTTTGGTTTGGSTTGGSTTGGSTTGGTTTGGTSCSSMGCAGVSW